MGEEDVAGALFDMEGDAGADDGAGAARRKSARMLLARDKTRLSGGT